MIQYHMDAASRVRDGWVLRIYITYYTPSVEPSGFMQVRVDEDFNMVSYLPQHLEPQAQKFIKLMRIPVILGLFPELEGR